MSFRVADMKERIMSNLRNLKQPIDKFRGIGISHDLTLKERQEHKRLVEAAKLEHADVSDDGVENFKFIVARRGSRQRVLKIRK